MHTDFTGEAIVCLSFLSVLLLVLAIGCAVADHLFPRIPLIARYMDSLPEFEDDAEIAKLQDGARRARAEERRQRRAEGKKG